MVVETTQKCISKKGWGGGVAGDEVGAAWCFQCSPPTCHHGSAAAAAAGDSDSAEEHVYLWVGQLLPHAV